MHLLISEKSVWAYLRSGMGCPIFRHPYYLRKGKSYGLQILYAWVDWNKTNKTPWKISGKLVMGVVRESRKFFGHCAVIFAIAQLSCCFILSYRPIFHILYFICLFYWFIIFVFIYLYSEYIFQSNENTFPLLCDICKIFICLTHSWTDTIN